MADRILQYDEQHKNAGLKVRVKNKSGAEELAAGYTKG